MSKKKSKFDLADLVHKGHLKEGETLYFVSNPSLTCKVMKLPSGDFKVTGLDGKPTTIYGFSQAALGTEPPEHASRWVRTSNGKTLYELWHADEDLQEAA